MFYFFQLKRTVSVSALTTKTFAAKKKRPKLYKADIIFAY